MTIISPLPFTLTNGTVADATQVQSNLAHIRDQVNANAAASGGGGGAAAFNGASVDFSSADQIIPDVTNTPITWENELFDTNGWFNAGGDPTIFTVPEGIAYVRVDVQLLFLPMTVNKYVDVRLYKNGADIYEVPRGISNGIDALPVRLSSRPIACVAGDEFQVIVYTNNGAPITCYTAGGQYPHFSIQAIG